MQDAAPTQTFSPDRLREATREAGLTQQALAFRLGMSIRSIQNWFGGTRSPGGAALIALAAVLDREPSWFYVIAADLDEAA